MIRSFNEHAANEWTFLAWVRTGLSTITLGIVVKKGSLLALVVAGASSLRLPGALQDGVSDYSGSVLVGIGIAAMTVAAVRFVRTALRIEDKDLHSAEIARLASAVSLREHSGEIERVSTNDSPASADRQAGLWRGVRRFNLRLVEGADVRPMHRRIP
jgi:putative membrane protein